MAVSLNEFTDRLAASELMTAAEVQEFVAAHFAAAPPADTDALAKAFVREKRLTAFQIQNLYQNKGKSLVLGNYVILEKLGQGGMGMVLKAEHRRMKRVVAIKVLSPTVVKTPELLERFLREVRAAARLTHPNIVAAFDADEMKGTHFLVMEYVAGADLSAHVKKFGPLAISKAINCTLQGAKGLQFAHQHGVIHRDIKPANLLLDESGTVKILDMGLARIESGDTTQHELTSTGAVMGTVDYMAPEQALNTKSADARSDIYSLGITLWYLLTGRPAYTGDSLMARLLAHRDAAIPSLTESRPDVPADLQAVFAKMVAKKPEDRHQSMGDVIAALEECQAHTGSSAPSVRTGPTEDSKLAEFLGNLAQGSAGTSIVASRATLKTATGKRTAAAAEATLSAGDVAEKTDPESRVLSSASLRSQAAVSKKGVKKQPTSAWRQDRRVQIGAAAVVALGVAAAIFLPGRKSETPSAPNAVVAVTPENETDKQPQTIAALPGPSPAAQSQTPAPPPNAWTPLDPKTPVAAVPASPSDLALSFDGVDDIVEVETWQYDGSHPVTLEAWLNLDPQRLPPKGFLVSLLGNGHWIRSMLQNQKFHLGCFNGANALVMTPPNFTPKSGWQHWAAIYKPDRTVDLFVDGQPLPTDQRSVGRYTLTYTGAALAFGGLSPKVSIEVPNPAFAGLMDEIRVSRTVRYTGPFTPARRFEPDADTILLYHCDEGSGEELEDASGHNFVASVLGPSWKPADAPSSSGSPVPAPLAGGAAPPLPSLRSAGQPLNSIGFDADPTFSADRLLVVFTSNRQGSDHGTYDLWMSERTSIGERWSEPVNLTQINNSKQQVGAWLSEDGLNLYFGTGQDAGAELGPMTNLAMSSRASRSEPFGLPVTFPAPLNSEKHDRFPTLTPDGLQLVFTSSRDGGQGSDDLWMSRRDSLKSDWQAPENLTNINSNKSDLRCSFSLDGLALYFQTRRNGPEEAWVARRTKLSDPFTSAEPLQLPGFQGGLAADGSTITSVREGRGDSGYWLSLAAPNKPGEIDMWFLPISTSTAAPATASPSRNGAGGLKFNGASSYIETPIQYDGSHPLTLEAWITPAGGGDGKQHIFSNMWNSGGLCLELWKNKELLPGKLLGTLEMKRMTFGQVHSSDLLTDGARSHAALVYDKGRLAVYVGGRAQTGTHRIEDWTVEGGKFTLQDTSAPWAAYANPKVPLLIGGRKYGNGNTHNWFRGTIDEVRISKTARYAGSFVPANTLATDSDTLALYRIDEGQGSILQDASGNGRTATIHDGEWIAAVAPAPAPAPPANPVIAETSLSLDGTTSVVKVPRGLDFSRPWTMEGWFTIHAPETPLEYGWNIFRNETRNRGAVSVDFSRAGSDYHVHAVMAGDKLQATPRTLLPLDQTLHVACVFDGQTVKLYLNGRNSGVTPAIGGFPRPHTSEIYVGGDWDGAARLKGEVHELRVSQVARYTGDFLPARNFTSDDQTFALYRVDEGSGNELKDSAGKNRHARITGTTWVQSRPTYPASASLPEGATAAGGGPPAKWAAPLNVAALNTRYAESTPWLTSDDCTLLFTSNRPGGQGGTDLWMSMRPSNAAAWSRPTNLGNVVNSPQNDYGPCMSWDGLTLCFTSSRPGGVDGTDLWFCTRSSLADPWGPPVNPGAPFNSDHIDHSPCFAADGLTLLLGSTRDNNWHTYSATRSSLRSLDWSAPVRLPGQVMPGAGTTLSLDGRSLIIAAALRGEKHDLWLSTRDPNSTSWLKSERLEGVNTPEDEGDPHLAADGQTLWFSSDRRGGAGSSDLYMSRRAAE